jgi:hypothetical protein
LYSVVSTQSPVTSFRLNLLNCDATAYNVSDYPMGVPPPPVFGTGLGEFTNDGSGPSGFISLPTIGGQEAFVVTRIYKVPEPSTLALLGVAGLAFIPRRKRSSTIQ